MWLLRPDGVIDPLPVSESRLLQRRRSSTAPTTSRPAAPDRARRAGRGGSAAGLAGGAAAAARDRAGGAARARTGRWSAPRVVGAGVTLAVQVVALPFGAWAHERAVDVGLSTQDWGAWMAGPREGRRRRGGAGGRWRGPVQRPDAALPAPLVARRRGRRGRDRDRVRVARAGGARPAVQPVRGPAAGPHAGGGHRARASGPVSTWATCSSWTPRAAPRPRTRTSTGSGTRSGWCSTTRCSSGSIPRRSTWSWPTSLATSSSATSRAACCGWRSSRRRGCTW